MGPLDDAELEAFARRDLARGRPCIEPVRGVVRGIDASGALVVDVALSGDGAAATTFASLTRVRAGSLVLAEEAS
jgi:hypothetical protein